MRYVIAGKHEWNYKDFREQLKAPENEWGYVRTSAELEQILSEPENTIEYIFFLHWSEIVPTYILQATNCVCFHMTDVPYGRGGSPLQNLIARGHRSTKITALRMTSELDAGPVYLKKELSLEGSTAEEIYQRASKLSCEMALQIAQQNLSPKEQTGTAIKFKRRTPEQSQIEGNLTLLQVFDQIRMLDAEGYPKAFIEIEGLRLEFSRASLYSDHVKTDVTITQIHRD